MRIDGFRPLSQKPRARRADRTRPDAEDTGPALIEATAVIPSEAEFERLSRNPVAVRALAPFSTPSARVLEALSSYSHIARLLDEAPARHYIDLNA